MSTKSLKLQLRSKQIEYPIIIGPRAINSLKDLIYDGNYSKLVLIADSFVAKSWAKPIKDQLKCDLLLTPRGENQKSITVAEKLWHKLQDLKVDRRALIINLGGGATTDLGGFVASTYLRGIRFINIPTTLLAQVDASIGGKVGINFANSRNIIGKNIIGNFAQPEAVLIDPQFLTTLDQRQFNSGLAEMLKHGALFSSKHFKAVLALAQKRAKGIDISSYLSKEIYRSCQLKAAIVKQDEREAGVRALLNFGHTIGHAIEALSLKTSRPLLHGEAIAIGMLAETALAEQLYVANIGSFLTLQTALKIIGLPTTLPNNLSSKINQIVTEIQKDKKVISKNLNFALITEIGRSKLVDAVSVAEIKRALTLVLP
jgi:3-dehydroquinate synthase